MNTETTQGPETGRTLHHSRAAFERVLNVVFAVVGALFIALGMIVSLSVIQH